MVGPVGSGKTTFAKSLKTSTSIRISQDEMGKEGHRYEFCDALEAGIPRIIVDRMNFNVKQRRWYINAARSFGYCVTIMEMEYCPVQCASRVSQRENHPTIESGNIKLANKIIKMYKDNYQAPKPSEYDNYNLIEMDR